MSNTEDFPEDKWPDKSLQYGMAWRTLSRLGRLWTYCKNNHTINSTPRLTRDPGLRQRYVRRLCRCTRGDRTRENGISCKAAAAAAGAGGEAFFYFFFAPSSSSSCPPLPPRARGESSRCQKMEADGADLLARKRKSRMYVDIHNQTRGETSCYNDSCLADFVDGAFKISRQVPATMLAGYYRVVRVVEYCSNEWMSNEYIVHDKWQRLNVKLCFDVFLTSKLRRYKSPT